MKKKLLLLFSISTLLFVSSCSFRPLSNITIGDKCYLDVRIFQAFSSHEALATTNSSHNDIVVKLLTAEDTFYDGKKVAGKYIMVDTYTYSQQDRIKTVPVFIKVSEYNTFKPLQEQRKEPEGLKI